MLYTENMKNGEKKQSHVSYLSSEELHMPHAANTTSLAQNKPSIAQGFASKCSST